MQLFNQSDDELWHAISNDNELAFAALFERYWELLYNTAYHRTRNHEESEEMVHDIFLNIWERRKVLQINSFRGYLLTSVRYQIYNRMRSVKPTIVSIDDNYSLDYARNYNEGENRLKVQELHTELSTRLDELPKRCREIFRMSRINHLSNQEIANQLGISLRSVENQISIALKHLKGYYKHMIYIIAFLSVLH